MKNTFVLRASLGVAVLFAPAFVKAADTHPTSSVTPEVALKRLQAGNARFVRGRLMGATNLLKERRALASGQSPFAAVLSCADSRVPPEEVFDQGLGKVFAVRVAGNVATQEGIASLEYAVTNLKTTLIVVMGHTACGAVKATLSTAAGQSLGSPALDALASEIRPNLRDQGTDAELDHSIEENVRAACRNLKGSSKILSDLMDRGTVKIVPALYNLQTGAVKFLSE